MSLLTTGFNYLFNKFKGNVQEEVKKLTNLFQPKKKGMEFKIGENVKPQYQVPYKQPVDLTQAIIARAEKEKKYFGEPTFSQAETYKISSNLFSKKARREDLTPEESELLNGAMTDIAFNLMPVGSIGSKGGKIAKNINFLKNADEFIGNIRKSKLAPEVQTKLEDLVKVTGNKLEQNTVSLKRIDELSKSPKTQSKIIDEILSMPEGGFAGEVRKSSKELVDTLLDANATIDQKLNAAIKSSQIRSEAGRAVVQFREPIDNAKLIKETLEDQLGKAKTPEEKQAIQKILDLSGVADDVPGLWDKIIEATTAAKLTSPFTFVKNAVGNTLARLVTPIEKTIAGGISGLESAVTGKARERFIGEGISDTFGLVRGLGPSLKVFFRGLADEAVTINSFKALEMSAKQKGGAISGLKGKIIRAPFRLLGAADEAFKTLGSSAELNSLAYRQAKKEGLSGPSMWRRIEQLAKNPTKEMEEEATDRILESVFQKKLGKTGASVQNVLNTTPATKLIVPFFKTPVNLFKYTFQRGQLGLLSPRNLTEILKGGQGKRSEALARTIMGQLTGAYLTWQALEGNITGRGPSNKSERDALYRTGWQPNAVKVGDKYISYRGFEPLSSQLSLAAAIAEDHFNKKTETIPTRIESLTKSVIKNMADQPFLTGLKNTLDAWSDPDRSGNYLESFFSGLIPTGIAFTARLIDPIYRETTGLKEKLQVKIPGLSQKLPEQRNALGDIIKSEGNLLQRLSPARITTESISNVDKELKDLDIVLQLPSDKIDGISLTSKEKSALLKNTGKIIKGNIANLLAAPGYQELSPDMKKKVIQNQINVIGVQLVKSTIRINANLRQLGLALTTEEKQKVFPSLNILLGTEQWKKLDDQKKKEFINNLLKK